MHWCETSVRCLAELESAKNKIEREALFWGAGPTVRAWRFPEEAQGLRRSRGSAIPRRTCMPGGRQVCQTVFHARTLPNRIRPAGRDLRGTAALTRPQSCHRVVGRSRTASGSGRVGSWRTARGHLAAFLVIVANEGTMSQFPQSDPRVATVRKTNPPMCRLSLNSACQMRSVKLTVGGA